MQFIGILEEKENHIKLIVNRDSVKARYDILNNYFEINEVKHLNHLEILILMC